MAVIFDLDQTLIDTRVALHLRKARKWPQVYRLVPEFRPYPGVSNLLRSLTQNEIPICIVTSSPSPYCTRILTHNGWQVACTVCYHDTHQHKPHPAPILKGLELLKISASEAVAVGDEARDVESAIAAGVQSVAAAWGSLERDALLNAGPDIVCEVVRDLRDFLEGFLGLRLR